VRGAVPSRAWRVHPGLTNAKLFARDRQVCAYCGGQFHVEDLTREHIVPVSRGGKDTWMNCITACRPCNGRKGNRLPEESRMSLLYLPYVPSLHEDMILRGRRILADQMEFLLASVPRYSRLHPA
jgi:5-methylcytosine-specific restriction endonuclease McrA